MIRSRTHILILLSILAIYGSISLFVDFFHDHEPGFSYEDNCPACQWEKQVQDNHSEYEDVLKQLFNLFNHATEYRLFENQICQDQTDQTYYLSRAPPVSPIFG